MIPRSRSDLRVSRIQAYLNDAFPMEAASCSYFSMVFWSMHPHW